MSRALPLICVVLALACEDDRPPYVDPPASKAPGAKSAPADKAGGADAGTGASAAASAVFGPAAGEGGGEPTTPEAGALTPLVWPTSGVAEGDGQPKPILVAVDVSGDVPAWQDPVKLFRRHHGTCKAVCSLGPLQGLASAEGAKAFDPATLVRVDGLESSVKAQDTAWSRVRGAWSSGKVGRRTPARGVVNAWLDGKGLYEGFPVLVVWFDGLIDESNEARLRDANRPLPAGAWAVVGAVQPAEKDRGKVKPAPVLVYVLARPGAVAWGRKVAEDISGAMPEDAHVFAKPALELLPGRAPQASATVTWTGPRDGQVLIAGEPSAKVIQSGAVVPLPAQIELKSTGGNQPGMTYEGMKAAGDDLPKVEVTVALTGFAPPAALPDTWLPAIGEPSEVAVEAPSAQAWGLDSGHVQDLAHRISFGAACAASGGRVSWYFGEVLPCPIALARPEPNPLAPKGPGQGAPLMRCPGRVGAGALSALVGSMPSFPKPGTLLSPSCLGRIGFGLVDEPRGGDEATVGRRPLHGVLTSKVSMAGAARAGCDVPTVRFSESEQTFDRQVAEAQAACPSPLWNGLASLPADIKAAFVSADFKPEGGGKIPKLRGLEHLVGVAFDFALPGRDAWLTKRDVLTLRYHPGFGSRR